MTLYVSQNDPHTRPEVDPDADWRPLMRAVILQSLKDVRGADPVRALDALLFLLGLGFDLWLEAVEIDADPLRFVIGVQAPEIKARLGSMWK